MTNLQLALHVLTMPPVVLYQFGLIGLGVCIGGFIAAAKD